MTAEDLAGALKAVLASRGRPVDALTGLRRLTGGAVQETWGFEAVVEGCAHRMVLRRAPGGSGKALRGTLDLATQAALGQAAAVCLYAIAEADEPPAPEAVESRASAADVERLTSLLLAVLETSGYTRRHPANARPASVRRMALRMGLTAAYSQVLMGLLRQLQHAIDAAV